MSRPHTPSAGDTRPSRLRNGAALTACALLAMGLSVAPSTPALAASATVSTAGDLADALRAALPGDTITLGTDIAVTPTDAALAVTSEGITLDVAGHTLSALSAGGVPGVDVPLGTGLTIRDSSSGGTLAATGGEGAPGIGAVAGAGTVTIAGGTVTAQGGGWGAGIGGGPDGNGATLTISGGTVTAQGSGFAAGIGGGSSGDGGTTTITGGSVTARGMLSGAGIGGGYHGDGGVTTISGGTVHASSGPGWSVFARQGASIGGGGGRPATDILPATAPGAGADLVIGSGANVTLTSGELGGPAIGGGGGSSAFGTFSNAGTLTLTDRVRFVVPTGITVANSGTIINDGLATNRGLLRNTGTITNNAAFANPGVITSGGTVTDPSTAIAGNNFRLELTAPIGIGEPADPTRLVRVYAPTLDAAEATLPAEPALRPTGHGFGGWYDADSELLTTATTFTSDALYRAHWVLNTYSVTFDSRGGTSIAAVTAYHGSPLGVPAPPTRSGHTFTGWFTAASGGSAWDFGTALTGDRTLYAQWAADASVPPTPPAPTPPTPEVPATPTVPAVPGVPASPAAPAAAPLASPLSAPLASTGAEALPLAGGALALLAGGALLFLLRRRQA